MDLNATKSAQEPKESSEEEAKLGWKTKSKKAKKKEKKVKPQSVIEGNTALKVEVKASTSSKDTQVCKDLAKKEGNNDDGNQCPISESSKPSKLQHETKEEIFPQAEEMSEPKIDLHSNKNPESELIKDFDSMDVNATKSAQEPNESSEEEAKRGRQKKSKKTKKRKKKSSESTSIDSDNVIPETGIDVPEEALVRSDEELDRTKALASEFDIKFKPGGATNCKVCSILIGSTYVDIHAHIQSIRHKRKFFKESKISPHNYNLVRLEVYNKQTLLGANTVKGCMIINSQICIDFLSYHVFVNEGDELKCYVCNTTVQDRRQHSAQDLHRRLWGSSLVITSLQMEFVREVKKGVFHCGFCNAIFTQWDALLEHLMALSHKRRKVAAARSCGIEMDILLEKRMEELTRTVDRLE